MTLLLMLYIIGITAEAMTGALAAGRNKLDLFGVIIIASITAIGGGTVRDVVFGHYPVGWVKHPEYFIICACAAVITIFIAPILKYFTKIFLILDSIGLVVFSIIGAQVAIDLGHNVVIASLGAILTGVSGGILRDMLTGRIPLVFQKELYASVSLIAALVYYYLIIYGEYYLGINYFSTVIITLIIGFTLRMLAIYYNLSLPVFNYQENSDDFPKIPIVRYWNITFKKSKRKKKNLNDNNKKH